MATNCYFSSIVLLCQVLVFTAILYAAAIRIALEHIPFIIFIFAYYFLLIYVFKVIISFIRIFSPLGKVFGRIVSVIFLLASQIFWQFESSNVSWNLLNLNPASSTSTKF